ncbi:hypothetical protein ACQR16_34105 [Bradyrhizobium oligotrophicum]|uniref:hypothetical protein n=1 Tax=Bradyrhizobium oligotrophicum TaxID=44255 RepID=UPI003EB78566
MTGSDVTVPARHRTQSDRIFERMEQSRHGRLLMSCSVMAGLVPAIHVVLRPWNEVDARAFAAPKRFGRAGETSPAMTA